MINPSRVHRAKGVITAINTSYQGFTVTSAAGNKFEGYFDHCGKDISKFKLGDTVSIQVKYSIMAQDYIIRSVNKPRKVKAV